MHTFMVISFDKHTCDNDISAFHTDGGEDLFIVGLNKVCKLKKSPHGSIHRAYKPTQVQDPSWEMLTCWRMHKSRPMTSLSHAFFTRSGKKCWGIKEESCKNMAGCSGDHFCGGSAEMCMCSLDANSWLARSVNEFVFVYPGFPKNDVSRFWALVCLSWDQAESGNFYNLDVTMAVRDEVLLEIVPGLAPAQNPKPYLWVFVFRYSDQWVHCKSSSVMLQHMLMYMTDKC